MENKYYDLKETIFILTLFLSSFFSYSQIPFKIDPTTGLHLLDGNNNPILNDKNYIITPVANYEFTSEPSTRSDWMYEWTSGELNSCERNEKDGFFYVTGDVNKDNMTANNPAINPYPPYQTCPQSPSSTYSNNNFSYTYNRDFNTTGGVSTVTLKTRKESTPIKGYYTKYDCAGATKYPKTYNYTTAVLLSKNAYKYGYFEERFKVNGLPNNQSKGIGHAFWLSPNWKYSSTVPPNIPTASRISDYSEIDIAECDARRGLMTGGAIYKFSNYGIWQGSSTDAKDLYFNEEVLGTNCQGISTRWKYVDQNNFHTYSLEWTPTEINTYYDNLLVSHIEVNFKPDGRVFTPDLLDPMRIVLDIESATSADSWHGRFCEIVDNSNVLPFEFTIDYVRLYKLDNSTCNLAINQPNYNFNNYTHGIKKSITYGQNNCTNCQAIVQNGMNISLRATDYIELNDGFEVDNNSFTEFFATVNRNCSN